MAWALATAQWLAPAVLLVALGLVVTGRLRPWAWPEPAALLLALATVAVVAVTAVALRVHLRIAARAADRGLATKDTFATALEVDPEAGPLPAAVVERAATLASGVRPRDAVPFRTAGRRLAFSSVLMVAAVGLAVAPNRQDDIRRDRAAQRAAVEAEAEAIEEVAEAIRDDPEASAGELEVAERLEELAEAMERSSSLQEAEEALRQAQAELNSMIDPDLLAQKAAAVGLDRGLESAPLPGASGSDAAEQLQQAAEALDQLSAEETAALADRLEVLAGTQAVANPALADALQRAASALASGDTAGAQAALGEAAAAQDAAGESVAGQEAAQAASAALTDAQNRLANGDEEAQGQGQGQGQGEGEGEGQGQGQGEGEGQGQGQSQGQGAGGASGNVGGTNAATGSGSGGQGRPTGGSDNASVGLGLEGAEVFDPGTEGEQLDANGNPTGNDPGETTGRSDASSGSGASFVPLADVLADYETRATRTLERADIPPSVRALVRAYFDALAGRQ